MGSRKEPSEHTQPGSTGGSFLEPPRPDTQPVQFEPPRPDSQPVQFEPSRPVTHEPPRPDTQPFEFERADPPLITRITLMVNATMAVLSMPLVLALTGLAAIAVLAVVVTRLLREDRGLLIGIAWIALFVVLTICLTAALFWVISKVDRLKYLSTGKPRFAPLPSMGRRDFDTCLRMSKSLDVKFSEHDMPAARIIARNTLVATQNSFRRSYVEQGFDEDGWPDTWSEIRHAGPSDGDEFGESIQTCKFGLLTLKTRAVNLLVRPLAIVFEIGYLWLLASLALGGSLLPLLQFCMVTSLLLGWLIYINFTLALKSGITIFDERDQPTELVGVIDDSLLPAPYLEEGRALVGETLSPTVSSRPPYTSLIRRQYIRSFCWGMSIEAFVLVVLVLFQYVCAELFGFADGPDAAKFTLGMLIGCAVFPLAFCGFFAMAFSILEHFRRLTVLLFTGAVLAVVPPLIAYAFSGSTSSEVVVTSVVTALVGCLGAAIAEVVKDSIQESSPGGETDAR